MKLIGKLLCKMFGHKRGRIVGLRVSIGEQIYRCPRCNATWARKVKAKVAA